MALLSTMVVDRIVVVVAVVIFVMAPSFHSNTTASPTNVTITNATRHSTTTNQQTIFTIWRLWHFDHGYWQYQPWLNSYISLTSLYSGSPTISIRTYSFLVTPNLLPLCVRDSRLVFEASPTKSTSFLEPNDLLVPIDHRQIKSINTTKSLSRVRLQTFWLYPATPYPQP